MRLSVSLAYVILFASLLFPGRAISACFNPFGCTPKTREQCLASAGEARTQTAARAMLANCSSLPSENTTERNCAALSASWVSYMQKTGGIESGWGKTAQKLECAKFMGFEFQPAQWVTKNYCEKNRDFLEMAMKEVDAETGDTAAMRRVKHNRPYYSSLDDDQIIDLIHKSDYPDLSRSDVAKALGATYPKNPHKIYIACVLLPSRSAQNKN